MAKKRKFIKPRRKFQRSDFFPQEEKALLHILNLQLHTAFPNKEERIRYIEDLIVGLRTEPICEMGEENAESV
jgi:hypothetical protein